MPVENLAEIEQELDFSDLEPIQIPVKVRNQEYVLHEASGAVAKAFNNARLKSLKFGKDGQVVGVEDAGGIEAYLVSMLLRTKDGKAVPKQTIEAFPERVLKKLFKRGKEISELDELDPTRELLSKAFSQEGTPIAIADLREYVQGLKGDEWKPLKLFFKPSDEEEAKNEQSDSMDG